MTLTYSLNELNVAAQRLWQEVKGQRVIVFSGVPGAGKTTLIRAFCLLMGVSESEISSPTFSIINEYAPASGIGFSHIFHMDWYRLADEEEALQAGVEDALLQQDALCLVEWPARAAGLLQMPYVGVRIEAVTPDSPQRTLHVELYAG